jgi:hypothetical protein
MASAMGDGCGYALRDISSLSSIKSEVETRYPLAAVVINPPVRQQSSVPEETPVHLLQRQIVLESHRNWDNKAPTFSKLWAFGAYIEKPKQFFALDRWPPQLQTSRRLREILESGPAPESPKPLPTIEKDNIRPKPGETIYHGDTFFPFGETPIQQALLAYGITKDLAGGNFCAIFHPSPLKMLTSLVQNPNSPTSTI